MDRIADLLEKLAKTLNTTVGHLWAVTVKQANIFIVTTIIDYIITAISVYLCYRVAKKIIPKIAEWDRDYDNTGKQILWTCILVFWEIINLAFVIVSMAHIGDMITAIYNPEFWALEKILNMLKSIK